MKILRWCFSFSILFSVLWQTSAVKLHSSHSIVPSVLDVTEPVSSELVQVERNGKQLLIREDLRRKLQEEDEVWHLTPWLRTKTERMGSLLIEAECVADNSIESFPNGPFTDEQLRQGGFILYVLFGAYAFTLLAIVCNDYFIPCVELICEDLKIPQNVAAATFMSVATSCPEFFVNLISTFLTESDMGIGTIVGSGIFNALGVAAIGSLAALGKIKIEPGPVTRDVIIYMINVGVLFAIVWDGQVEWYEAMVLGILYVIYFIIMFNSTKVFRLLSTVQCFNKKLSELSEEPEKEMSEENGNVVEGKDNKGFQGDNLGSNGVTATDSEKAIVFDDDDEDKNPKNGVWRFPSHKSLGRKIWWILTWPLQFVLSVTIPSTVSCRKFYPMAFIMCIVWIGLNSYVVSWCMTVLGHTFFIPDSVMGMTFLAFGGCLPEACSIYIMSRQGKGGIGVSNALGANSLAILFALGLPWLIKTLTLVASDADITAVHINSNGIDFVVGSLLVAVTCLWITLLIGKFTLKRSVGYFLTVLYVIFITFAVLVEMGIILDRGIAIC